MYLLSQQDSLALEFVGFGMMQHNGSCRLIQRGLHNDKHSVYTHIYKVSPERAFVKYLTGVHVQAFLSILLLT